MYEKTLGDDTDMFELVKKLGATTVVIYIGSGSINWWRIMVGETLITSGRAMGVFPKGVPELRGWTWNT